MFFHDQKPNRMWWQNSLFTKFVSKRFQSSKPCSQTTKTVKTAQKLKCAWKTSKTATECLKTALEMVFCDQVPKQTLLSEKTFFWSKSCKNAPNHLKLAQKRQIGQTTQNFEIGWKRPKLLKVNISCFKFES